MPASKPLKTLSIRIPEPLLRNLKITAAARGISLQQVAIEAINAWISHPQPQTAEPLERFRGSLAGTNAFEEWRRDREAELAREETRISNVGIRS